MEELHDSWLNANRTTVVNAIVAMHKLNACLATAHLTNSLASDPNDITVLFALLRDRLDDATNRCTASGFNNHPTFLTNLRLEQSPKMHARILRTIDTLNDEAPTAEQVREAIWTHYDYVRIKLADLLKAQVRDEIENRTDHATDDVANLMAGLLHHATSEVDWRELAEYWLHKHKDITDAAPC